MSESDEKELHRALHRAFGEPSEYEAGFRQSALRRPWVATSIAAASVAALAIGIALFGGGAVDKRTVATVNPVIAASDTVPAESSAFPTTSAPATESDLPLGKQTAECTQPPVERTGAFRVDTAWTVTGAIICASGSMHLTGLGIWQVNVESEVRSRDLDEMIDVLNRRDIKRGMDDGFCGPPVGAINGIVLTLADGSTEFFPQPQLGCTRGPDDDHLKAISRSGTLRYFPITRLDGENEVSLPCKTTSRGSVPDFRMRGGIRPNLPTGPAVCLYMAKGGGGELTYFGLLEQDELDALWASITDRKYAACPADAEKWITITRTSGSVGALPENAFITHWYDESVAAVFEVGGCSRVFDGQHQFYGVADPAKIATIANLAVETPEIIDESVSPKAPKLEVKPPLPDDVDPLSATRSVLGPVVLSTG